MLAYAGLLQIQSGLYYSIVYSMPFKKLNGKRMTLIRKLNFRQDGMFHSRSNSYLNDMDCLF